MPMRKGGEGEEKDVKKITNKKTPASPRPPALHIYISAISPYKTPLIFANSPPAR